MGPWEQSLLVTGRTSCELPALTTALKPRHCAVSAGKTGAPLRWPGDCVNWAARRPPRSLQREETAGVQNQRKEEEGKKEAKSPACLVAQGAAIAGELSQRARHRGDRLPWIEASRAGWRRSFDLCLSSRCSRAEITRLHDLSYGRCLRYDSPFLKIIRNSPGIRLGTKKQ